MVGKEELKELGLTPQEAYIIEACLKNGADAFRDYRWFLIQIGACLASDKPVAIGVSAEDVWFLRNLIVPTIKVGKTSGMDIIIKLYRLLLEFENDQLLKGLRIAQYPPKYSTAIIMWEGSEDEEDD